MVLLGLKRAQKIVFWVPILTLVLGSIGSFYIYKYLCEQDESLQRQNAYLRSKEEVNQIDLTIANSLLRIQSYDDFLGFKHNSYKSDRTYLSQALEYTIFHRLSVFRDVSDKSKANKEMKLKLLTRISSVKSKLPHPTANDLIISEVLFEAIQKIKESSSFFGALIHVRQEIPRFSVIVRSKNDRNIYLVFTAPLLSIFENIDLEDDSHVVVSDDTTKNAWMIQGKDNKRQLKPVGHQDLQPKKSFFRFKFDKALPQSSLALSMEFNFSKAKSSFLSAASIGGTFSILLTFIIAYLFYVLVLLNRKANELISSKTIDLEKTAHDLQEALKGKTKFFGKISHEIRTPLNLILGMIDLCLESATDKKMNSYLSSMKASGEHLLSMIDDLLDIAKAESTGFNIEHRKTYLVQFLAEVTKLMGNDCRGKDLQFFTYFAPDLPSVVSCDPNRLRQILLNLLRNAVKYTNYGNIQLMASVDSRVPGKSVRLKFEILDTGVGIPEEKMNKVFDAFFQIESSSQLTEGGVGLGLSIVKDIVRRMNGTIEVSSSPFVGSSFRVYLDLDVISENSWLESYQSTAIGMKNLMIISNNELFQKTFLPLKKHPQINLFSARTSDFQGKNIADHGPDWIFIVDAENLDPNFASALKNKLLKDIVFVSRPGRPILSEFPKNATLIDNCPTLASEILLKLGFSSRARERKSEATAKAVQPLLQESVKKDRRIIVADDDLGNIELYKAYFSSTSWNINYALNGVEAWEQYQKEVPDLLILDIRMPILDGFGVIERVRRYEETNQLKQLPIIVVTADLLDGTAEKIQNFRNVSLLTKPLKKSVLMDLIDKQV